MNKTTCSIMLAATMALSAIVGYSAAGDSKEDQTARMERLDWIKFQARLKSLKDAKYTIVDAWASNCGPCKENFPHLLDMHKKYGAKGLKVVSLSLDDPSDQTAVGEAEKFLKQKNADIINVLLDEDYGVGFEKLNISAIPAVFLFGPDGKEINRFTMDDPNNQFTYDQVEKAVAALLGAGS